MGVKSIIKSIVPAVILKRVSGMFYGWSGNYSSWADAAAKCTGYDTDEIFNKVRNSLLKVKNGEAAYERDSVLFDEIQYSQPLLSALKYVAEKHNNSINILDFGGSLGSSYYQNKTALSSLKSFKWNIVEQQHFVTEGQKTFANEQLAFYYDIESCLKDNKVNVVLLSSVLQYIERPYELINKIIGYKIDFIIIDRAPVLLEGKDRITIQKVPKSIYKAQYPCWLLNEKYMITPFLKDYNLISEETSAESININNAAFKTFFLEIKS